ncbi:cell division protein ZipA [Nitrincola sp.]|uniref:cell division protein ZipA n=1 Tax=Nitrincola sp. TaxID=1926584 RepID=UPI003A9276BB
MDISLREWLIIGGVLIVILILVDGWRRVSANRSRLKLEIDRTLSELGDGGGDGHNPELPNGGARKRQGAEMPPAQPPSMRSKERVEPSLEPSVDAIPELTEMDPLFDDIPTREEASAARGRSKSRSRKPDAKPVATPAPVIEEPSPEPLFAEPEVAARNDDELLQAVDRGDLQGSALEMDYPLKEEPLPVYSEARDADSQHELGLDLDQPIPTLFDQIGTDLPDDTLAAYRDSFEREVEREESVQPEASSLSAVEPIIEPVADTGARIEPEFDTAPEPTVEPEQQAASVEEPTQPEDAAPVVKQGPKRASMPDPEHVLVITVVGRNGERLPGPALGKIVDACGMDWGDMSIYHRAEDSSPGSPIQFSMANAVAPGTFDPDNMDALETPAVTFFMSMSEPQDPMTAYECMLATAETLAKHLNGELIDEDRSVMRPQTKEHYRERIREFQMHQRQRRVN